MARDALRRQLRLTQFETIRRRMMPFAEARGFLTDEDVFAKMGLSVDAIVERVLSFRQERRRT